MNKRPKVGVGVCIVRSGKVLLGKRKGNHGRGCWCFPGGHLEFNETWDQCARRETLEETGLRIINLQFVTATNDRFKSEDKHYITLFILADYITGEAKIMEPDKCEQWQWFDWDNLPQPLFLPVKNLRKANFNPLTKH